MIGPPAGDDLAGTTAGKDFAFRTAQRRDLHNIL